LDRAVEDAEKAAADHVSRNGYTRAMMLSDGGALSSVLAPEFFRALDIDEAIRGVL
jgi:hypothetical protein